MSSLNVRNVPDETLERLAEAAREAGQSLQAYTRALLDHDAAAQHNREVLRAFENRRDGFSGTWEESQADIRAARDVAGYGDGL